MPTSHNTSTPFVMKDWLRALEKASDAGTALPMADSSKSNTIFSRFQSNPSAAADKKVPLTKRVEQRWEKSVAQHWRALEGGQKVNVAMWGAGALLSAFVTVSAARNAFDRDDEGKIHAQWSNVGVALLQATLAAGCAYAGVHALHSPAR